jgi:hypothetical protein
LVRVLRGQIVANGEGTNVIRITAQQESLVTRLFLEGKLSGPCVDELDKCWRTCPNGEVPLVVDLTNVSFVDERGKELLTRMHNKGIKLFSKSVMTKCLIEEIESIAIGSGDQISSRDQLLSPHATTSQEEIR